jgi:cytoskeletal protein RodZ
MIILVEKPIPRFIVSVASVFLGFIGILGFIFLPKVVAIVFYDPESSQFTIHASGGGIKSGGTDNSRPSITLKPPKANDPGSNPASNLEKWRRNSHLSSIQSDSTTVESLPSLTTNPIIMVGNIENRENKNSTAGLEIPIVASTSQEELEKGQS